MRKNHLEYLDKNYLGHNRLRSVEHFGSWFTHYRYEVIPYGKIIHEKSINTAYSTMCQCTVTDKCIPHWKCVLCCYFNFISVKLSYKNAQDDIDMINIKYHIWQVPHGIEPFLLVARYNQGILGGKISSFLSKKTNYKNIELCMKSQSREPCFKNFCKYHVGRGCRGC